MRKVVLCLTATWAIAGASCGDQHNLYPVSGKVTYKGCPATGAAVFFRRQGSDPASEHLIMGIVQEDGSFELVCGSLGKGAPPGEYDVMIEWKPATGRKKGGPLRAPDRLKGRYADPKQPRLHATVEACATNLPPFELAPDGREPGR